MPSYESSKRRAKQKALKGVGPKHTSKAAKCIDHLDEKGLYNRCRSYMLVGKDDSRKEKRRKKRELEGKALKSLQQAELAPTSTMALWIFKLFIWPAIKKYLWG